MRIFTYNEKKVIIENNVVTQSDFSHCLVGQKPNLKALKACGWKEQKTPKTVYAKGLSGRNFYN